MSPPPAAAGGACVRGSARALPKPRRAPKRGRSSFRDQETSCVLITALVVVARPQLSGPRRRHAMLAVSERACPCAHRLAGDRHSSLCRPAARETKKGTQPVLDSYNRGAPCDCRGGRMTVVAPRRGLSLSVCVRQEGPSDRAPQGVRASLWTCPDPITGAWQGVWPCSGTKPDAVTCVIRGPASGGRLRHAHHRSSSDAGQWFWRQLSQRWQ